MEVLKPEELARLLSELRQIEDCLQRAVDGCEGMQTSRPRASYVTRQVLLASDLIETARGRLLEALGQQGFDDLNLYLAEAEAVAPK